MMSPAGSALLTDLYQLTMLQGYFDHGMEDTAVFEFFVRRMPEKRNFLMAAGLDQVISYLEALHFSEEELGWLDGSGRFSKGFVDYLGQLRFTGDVHAMPEGTIFFPDEPILRITAPLPQAQLVESRIINIMHFQTLIASKAARCKLIAPDKLLVDFGLRRAHGAEAGLFAARASYLAGFAGSATTLAAPLYDIPIYGTMAHSFIQSHNDEMAAFENFAHAQPDNVVLLIDTYDTEAAAEKVVSLAPRLKEAGIPIKAVRLDSGDLVDHARKVRRILDDGNLGDVTIFASGGLDEYALEELVANKAPIDGFGIGTSLDTSADAPYLDCAYKLQEYAAVARRKRSEGKATWPGRKQVYRRYNEDGLIREDILTLEDAPCEGMPLICPIMRQGDRIDGPHELNASRDHAARELSSLPEEYRRLKNGVTYPVIISPALADLADEVDRSL
jgi:nicotinate phosphoribosyltransferase